MVYGAVPLLWDQLKRAGTTRLRPNREGGGRVRVDGSAVPAKRRIYANEIDLDGWCDVHDADQLRGLPRLRPINTRPNPSGSLYPFPPAASATGWRASWRRVWPIRWGARSSSTIGPVPEGTSGTELVTKAAPDGYTLLFCSPTFALSPSLYSRLGFDPVRDFSPVAQVASATNLVVVNPSLPINNVKELIEQAKARPGVMNYGSGGVGTSGQLAAELLKLSANVNIVHVPYKGAGLAVNALLGGEIQLMFAPLPLALPHVNAGKLRALAVTGITRSRAVPAVSTIAEAAIPGFDVTSWFGVLAPAATPKPIVNRLYADISKVLRTFRSSGTHGGPGCRAEPSLARRLWKVHPVRGEEVGRGDQTGGYHGGVGPSRRKMNSEGFASYFPPIFPILSLAVS